MSRPSREEVFSPDEIACVHVMNRAVRRCFLLGDDPISGKNFDHRKQWMETKIKRHATYFGIDLLGYTILDNHFHQVVRSRPDVVSSWDDTEVARRWMMICPARKLPDGSPEEPSEAELNSIRLDPDKLRETRSRLSDISWWMRLLCQDIAQRANAETEESGKFWQDRFRAVRLLDDTALLAAVAYVDLNPIRAALTEAIESSDFTSVKRRIEALLIQSAQLEFADEQNAQGEPTSAESANAADSKPEGLKATLPNSMGLERLSTLYLRLAARIPDATCVKNATPSPDAHLAPVFVGEGDAAAVGPQAGSNGRRCSDKGFLNMSAAEYIELLDWTARCVVEGKKGSTPSQAPAVFERLGISRSTWLDLTGSFGQLFHNVAGEPSSIASASSRKRGSRYRLRESVKQVFSAA